MNDIVVTTTTGLWVNRNSGVAPKRYKLYGGNGAVTFSMLINVDVIVHHDHVDVDVDVEVDSSMFNRS